MEEKFNAQNGNPNGSSKKAGTAWKIALMVILAVLVISPLDIVPDPLLLVGWIDDIAYVAGILGTAVGMIKGRKSQQPMPGTFTDNSYIPPMYNEVKSNRKR